MPAWLELLPVVLARTIQLLISKLLQVPVSSIPFVPVVEPMVIFLITKFLALLMVNAVPDEDIITLPGLFEEDEKVMVSLFP
jgi:hypothetical protein